MQVMIVQSWQKQTASRIDDALTRFDRQTAQRKDPGAAQPDVRVTAAGQLRMPDEHRHALGRRRRATGGGAHSVNLAFNSRRSSLPVSL